MRHIPGTFVYLPNLAARPLTATGVVVFLALTGMALVQPVSAFAAVSTLMVSTTADMVASSGACDRVFDLRRDQADALIAMSTTEQKLD